MGYVGVAVLVALVVVFVSKTWSLLVLLLWRPYAWTRFFEKQGIRGPPYSLLYGSLDEIKKLKKAADDTVLDSHSNDLVPRVFPHYHKWCSQYGETILYWYGTEPRITITDPELAKQVLSNKFGFYGKTTVRPTLLGLLGRKGLVLVQGQDWTRQRRILNPAFSMDTLKVIVKRMAACTISTVEEWENQISLAGSKIISIEVNMEFQKLTADIIAHTAFGSNYAQGKEAFNAQKELQKYFVASYTDIYIPGSQFLPTPSNLGIWKLDEKMKKSLRQIIENRVKSFQTDPKGFQCDDLLGLMIRSSWSSTDSPRETSTSRLNMDEVMENCKTFFFAGHETTSNLLTWAIFLLSLHQDWQEKLRREVLLECGPKQVPDGDMLAKLKLVNMVLLETLRLYCPVIELLRKASEDVKLGNWMVPKGTCMAIPVLKIHRSKTYWGNDAEEFNPTRFAGGVSKAAKHPNALLGFSLGPRSCIGQNFAMLESKMVLALLLQKFSFSLSSEYKHAPVDNITLHPQYGLPVVVTLLPS